MSNDSQTELVFPLEEDEQLEYLMYVAMVSTNVDGLTDDG